MPPVSAPPLSPGDVVGRYRVEAFVAQGGMGRVFRAWDTVLVRPVALKTIRGDQAWDRGALLRFQREAQVLARLDHPGICQVHDFLEHEGTLVMAMEWVEGDSLATLLQRGPLPLQVVLRLLRDLASALAAAHARGVIHRDLKPSNILIRKDGRAKVLDFGLAKASAALEEPLETWLAAGPGEEAPTGPLEEGTLTQPGLVVGTRGFLAPELLRGEPATAATDLYALGIIASLALTGEAPRGEGSSPWRQLAHRTGGGRRGALALGSLVQRLASPEPGVRPSAQEVVATLDRIQAPVSPFWWVVLASGLTLAGAGAGLWAYGRGAIPEFSTRRAARLAVLPIRNATGDPALTPAAEITTTDLLEHLLRTFPQVRVVQDRDASGEKARPRAEADEVGALQRLAVRTGADLVLAGEVVLMPGTTTRLLRVRLRDRQGRLRAERAEPVATRDFEPALAVPAVLKGLDRTLSPLGRTPEFPPMPSGEALEAYGAGLEFLRRGDSAAALPHLERAALGAPRFPPAVMTYGWALFHQGDARAQATIQWAVAAARESRDRWSEADGLIGLALLARRGRGQPAEEVALLEQAAGLGRALEDPDLQARALNEIGVRWIHEGDWPAAQRALSPALDLATASGNRRLRAHILVNLANRAKYLNQIQDARAFYLDALADARTSDTPLLRALVQTNLAVLDLEAGQAAAAEQIFLEVAGLRRDLGDLEGEHRSLLLAGLAAQMRGDPDLALARYRTAAEGARRLGFRLIEGRALYRLGDLLRARGRLAEAALRLREAVALLREKGTAANQAEALAALAECRLRQGEAAEGGRLLEAAHRLVQDRPQTWRARAWLLHRQGRAREAQEALVAALAFPPNEDPEHRDELHALMAAWRRRP